MSKKVKAFFPNIGMRIIKSAIAVELCFIVSFLRGDSGIVFYSQLAAIWCIQTFAENSKKYAAQRFTGTAVGAVYGLLFLLLKSRFPWSGIFGKMFDSVIISIMVIFVIYTTVLMKKKQVSYFACVVFLSVVVNHMTDANPYLFVWNRFLDTVIGIVIGIGVNSFSLPKDKQKDILFISGLDHTLLNQKDNLSDYSKVELNRILDDGANFTISTMRTPAAFMEPLRDIRLKLPVIAMDGAVLYDIREKMYLKTYIISHAKAKQLLELMKEHGLQCFTTVIVDDLLVIYYDELEDEVQLKLVNRLRRSPYRNYVRRPLPESEDVVYFMLLYPKQVIEDFYQVLFAQGIIGELKVIKYDSSDYPGYSCIKIYNKNASKDNMISYLKEMLHLEKTVTFGSMRGHYDYIIKDDDINSVVHSLKKLYEPIKRPGLKRKQ